MMTKTTLLASFAALFTVVGCAAGPGDEDLREDLRDDVQDETEADVRGDAPDETLGESTSALSARPLTPFCLPGEVRVCTLGPPPVCRCVPISDPPIVIATTFAQ